MLRKLETIIHKLSKCLGWISCAGVLVVTAFTVVSVFMRYCLNAPIIGSTEIVECMMSVMVFTCLAYTQSKKGHISISMVLRILPKRLGLVLNALNCVLVAAASGYVTYALFSQALYAMQKGLKTALIQIPYGPFYMVATICMAMFTLVLAADAVIAVIGIWNKKCAEETKSAWT